jgi:hypothetical protein
MSEMTKLSDRRIDLRAQLLSTTSAAMLLVALCASGSAAASDENSPVVWVELGGEFTQLATDQKFLVPPFTQATSRLPFITASPAALEKPVPVSWDGNAKVTFQPAGHDWIFSAGIIYGRSTRSRLVNQQPPPAYNIFTGGYSQPPYQQIAAKNNESHMILDFQAGRDFGLGMFGNDGHSQVSLGLRYAQFNSSNSASIYYLKSRDRNSQYYKFDGVLDAKRKFTGIGPSLSWDASAGLVGNTTAGISLDWGVNGAVLFGRQHVTGHHLTEEIHGTYFGSNNVPVYQNSAPLTRSRQVVVPNLGGFAGVSWRYPNAKVNVGYRADMFFGAMDDSIDTTHKSGNLGFYGPFASVSVGIGG